MAVKTHSINGIRYHIMVDEPYAGWCDKPDKPQKNEYPAIRLPEGLPYGNSKKAKEGLINLLHEFGHAEDYRKPEEIIDRVACELGTLLWRLGFRRTKSHK